MPFNNPYTFVPTPNRNLTHEFCGDHDPTDPTRRENHSRFWQERYSGEIRFSMTVETPLFIPERDGYYLEGHNKIYPGKDNPDKHHLTYDCVEVPPATSIKGVLRSAYECMTNSRFGVFGPKMAERQGRRMQVHEALRLKPCMVVQMANRGLGIRLMLGTTQLGGGGAQTPQHAAFLHRYDRSDPDDPERGVNKPGIPIKYPDGTLPEHGDRVVFKAETRTVSEDDKPRYTAHFVKEIWRFDDPNRPIANGRGTFDGYVFISNPTIKNKHFERVFFQGLATPPRDLPLDGSVIQNFESLITDQYAALHNKDLEARKLAQKMPGEYLGDEPGRTAWGRYIFDQEWTELKPPAKGKAGTLLFALIEGGKVKSLFPAMVSRDIHPQAPEKCLDGTLHPAKKLSELSPADRLFGWVSQNGNSGEGSNDKSDAAWKGKVRITNVSCQWPDGGSAVQKFDRPIPLCILGNPKIQQTYFYLRTRTGNRVESGTDPDRVKYDTGHTLQGRKTYWHHKCVAASPTYWTDAIRTRFPEGKGWFQEYRQAGGGEDVRTDQNRSISGWIKRKSTILFTLKVSNLCHEEVGGLLALATLPDDCFLKMGLGKPLGLGSVRLALDGSPDLVTGEQMKAKRYDTIEMPKSAPQINSNQMTPTDMTNAITAFKSAVAKAYGASAWEQTSFVSAFIRAGQGPNNENPIHYPRNIKERVTQDGKVAPSFEWFVSNSGRHGNKTTLPDAVSSESLMEYGQRQQRNNHGR